MFYAFCRGLFSTALEIFYRWTRTEGVIPESGPLVIVGNHQNGLIDPAAVMRLTRRPVRFLAKAPIFKAPVLGSVVRGMRCLPVYRKQDEGGQEQMGKNDETFKAAHASLQQGEAICIFPEGRSHSGPSLEPLKTGAARIALGAEAERGFTLGVKFVAVGFSYREKGVFRSEVAVAVGAPIEVADLQDAYAADPIAAAHTLTDRLDAALRAVTMNLDSWEDLPLIEAAAKIYRAERGARVDLRPFAAGLSALRERDPARLASVRARVLRFFGSLADLGIPLEDLDHVTRARSLRFVLVHGLALLVLGPLALLGLLAFAPPYQLIRFIAHAAHPEEDMQGSLKLGTALALFPLWDVGLALVGHHFFGWPGVLLGGVGLGVCALLGMLLGERERKAWRNARAFLALNQRDDMRGRLLARRRELAGELEGLGQEMGVMPVP
jgi:glycerol-3-phosphate O-acyltransferase/dihydroxyacetone phosphate acyltransferase